MPFLDGRPAAFVVTLSVTVYRLNSLLQALVPIPADRLFLILRTAEGAMLWASNGKFFSHSDIDLTQTTP